MKSKIILCTGGARSGKSEFAEKFVLSQSGRKAYVATSQIYDEEMAARVKTHKNRRGTQWQNFEIPKDLPAHWAKIIEQADVILVDCVTMYITNALLTYDLYISQDVRNKAEQEIIEGITKLIELIENTEDKTVVFVTNELGLGIVPENMLSRIFRDIVGLANQKLAQAASLVYLSVSGITMEIKSREVMING